MKIFFVYRSCYDNNNNVFFFFFSQYPYAYRTDDRRAQVLGHISPALPGRRPASRTHGQRLAVVTGTLRPGLVRYNNYYRGRTACITRVYLPYLQLKYATQHAYYFSKKIFPTRVFIIITYDGSS